MNTQTDKTKQSAALSVIARRFGCPGSAIQAAAFSEMAERCAVNAEDDRECSALAETVCDSFEQLYRQLSVEDRMPYWLAPVFSNCATR